MPGDSGGSGVRSGVLLLQNPRPALRVFLCARFAGLFRGITPRYPRRVRWGPGAGWQRGGRGAPRARAGPAAEAQLVEGERAPTAPNLAASARSVKSAPAPLPSATAASPVQA